MTEILALGDSDLATVACSVVAHRLAGIEMRGAEIPALLTHVYPTDVKDLPVFCIACPTQGFTQGAGRNGSRAERIAAMIRVTLVMQAPKSARSRLDIDAGKVVAEVARRMASDTNLRLADDTAIATDMTLSRVDKGFSDAGSVTVLVAQMTFNATIHHREGDHASVFAR